MLSVLEQSVNQQVQKAVNKEIEKLLDEIKKQVPLKLVEIRKEVFQSYKIIVSALIENYFVAVYGDSFDLASLQNSLIYIPGVEICPSISYDPSIFRFNNKVERQRNRFNQNARETQRKNRRKVDTGFYAETGAFNDYYDSVEFDYNTADYSSEDDYMEDVIMDYEELVPVNKDYRQGIFDKISLDSTYQRAIAKAVAGFQVQYRKEIKPRLQKKYKIQFN